MRLYCGIFLGLMMSILVGLHAGELKIVASIPPYEDVISRIGKDRVAVVTFLPEFGHPEAFEPTPKLLKEVDTSVLVVITGLLPFEEQLKSYAKKREIPILDVSELLKGQLIEGDHHNHGAHAHADPHVWMSPVLMKQVSAEVLKWLESMDSTRSMEFRVAHDEVQKRLDAIIDSTTASAIARDGKPVLIYHPFLAYYCRDFGLSQLAVEHDGHAPSARRLTSLLSKAQILGLKTLVVQPQFGRRLAMVVVRKINGDLLVINPVSSDYFGMLSKLQAHL